MSKIARSTRGQSFASHEESLEEKIWRELVRESFASFEFDASPCSYDPEHLGNRENATLSGLSRAETVKEIHLLMEFWPSIGDIGFNVGNTKLASIRDLKVKLAHRCIATTISGRKESTNRVIEINLYYLYCIYTEGVACNIPYWLAKVCVWPATRTVEEDNEAEEDAGGEALNEGAGGFAEMYRNMSQGDWKVRQARWMDLQDEHNLDPHLQIDPFPGREADYPPFGYHGYMPLWLYLMRRSLEVPMKFHLMILGGQFYQFSHVSSPLLSKLEEY
ncbi:hypothetical protein Tco_1421496 [Tanacetum coccineum]